MPVPEDDILKAIEPSVTNSNDYPEFTLHNARIVYQSNGKPANLLVAYADTPLRVEGRLDPPKREQAKYFLEKPQKPVEIEVRDVTRFSYGERIDQTYVIWAQGKAGWFEIRPSPRYESIFNDTYQAVELLYFVTDIYNEPRKRGNGPSAQLVFQEYAEDERFPCDNVKDAEAIFNKHHVFLMMCFLNREQGLSWSATPIYSYFRRHHPEDFENCKARKESRYTETQDVPPTRTSKPSPIPTSTAKTSGAKGRPPRGGASVPQTNGPPKKDENWWGAAALFEFMQKVVNLRVLRVGRSQITIERVAELIVKRYEIEELETARNVLLVHAKNLCYMMDHPKRKNTQFFTDEPIYTELSAGHSLSAVEQRRSEGIGLRPRKDHASLRDEQSESSNTSDDEVVATPVRRVDRRKKGRLSVLRPKSSKYSGKSKGIKVDRTGKAGKGKAPVTKVQSSSDNSSAEQTDAGTSSEDDGVVDTPTQALSPGREKRKLDDTDAYESENPDRWKRAASTSAVTPMAEDEDTEEATGGPPLPLRYRPSKTTPNGESTTATKSALVASIISTPLPTYEANGPRDSWICTFDGCSQKVYKCSREIGRQLITEHLEDHSKGREKVVGILWREQDQLQLPVNNLIKRIRELSEANKPLFPTSTVTQPKPIQRSV